MLLLLPLMIDVGNQLQCLCGKSLCSLMLIVTDHFGGSGRAVDPVCVRLCVQIVTSELNDL